MAGNEITQRIALKAVIAKNGKLLVLREASTYEDGSNTGWYHFPGGRLNPGEPFMDGLRREVIEETGLQIKVGEPLFVGEWFPVIKGVPNQIVAMFIVCQAEDSKIVLSEEHDMYRWIDETEMAEISMMPPDDEVIRAYYRRYAVPPATS